MPFQIGPFFFAFVILQKLAPFALKPTPIGDKKAGIIDMDIYTNAHAYIPIVSKREHECKNTTTRWSNILSLK